MAVDMGFAEPAGIFPHHRAQRCSQSLGSLKAGQEAGLSPPTFQTIFLHVVDFKILPMIKEFQLLS
jgi:hypothetical protein